MVFGIFATLAEFERDLIRERTTGRNLMKTPDFANFISTFMPLATRKRE